MRPIAKFPAPQLRDANDASASTDLATKRRRTTACDQHYYKATLMDAFVQNFMEGQTTIQGGLKAFVDAVKSGEYPSEEHSYR